MNVLGPGSNDGGARRIVVIGTGWLMQINGIASMLRPSTAIRLVAADRTFLRLRAAGEERWNPCSAAVIPAGRMAFIEAKPAAHLAAIFVDADSLLGRRLAYASNTDGGAHAWSDLGDRIIDVQFWTAVDNANWVKAIEILHSRVNLQARPRDTRMECAFRSIVITRIGPS